MVNPAPKYTLVIPSAALGEKPHISRMATLHYSIKEKMETTSAKRTLQEKGIFRLCVFSLQRRKTIKQNVGEEENILPCSKITDAFTL